MNETEESSRAEVGRRGEEKRAEERPKRRPSGRHCLGQEVRASMRRSTRSSTEGTGEMQQLDRQPTALARSRSLCHSDRGRLYSCTRRASCKGWNRRMRDCTQGKTFVHDSGCRCSGFMATRILRIEARPRCFQASSLFPPLVLSYPGKGADIRDRLKSNGTLTLE